MKKTGKTNYIKIILVFSISALIVFLVDRFIKESAISFLTNDLVIIKDFFKLTYSENIGVAFGIKLPFIIQIILVPVLLIAGFYYMLKNFKIESSFVLIVSGVITGGAISNYADRLIHGYVVDYISIWIWPVFNIADIAITLGIFTILVFYGKIRRV